MSSRRNQLMKLSKKDLVKKCKQCNVSSNGTKQDMADRIITKSNQKRKKKRKKNKITINKANESNMNRSSINKKNPNKNKINPNSNKTSTNMIQSSSKIEATSSNVDKTSKTNSNNLDKISSNINKTSSKIDKAANINDNNNNNDNKDPDIPKIWRLQRKKLKKKCLLIISNWLRVHTFNKVILGQDILMFLSLYLDYKMYKSTFSPLYAGAGIEFNKYNNNSLPTTMISGYGVSRMIDPLPHGTITEFTVTSGAPLVGIMSGDTKCYQSIGKDGNSYTYNFTHDWHKLYGFYGMSYGYGEEQFMAGGNYRMSSNKYGFICCNKLDWNFDAKTKNEWVLGSGIEHKTGSFIPFQRWSGPNEYCQIVVRVNLIDYVISFWEKRSGHFIALREGFYKSKAVRRGDRWYSYTHGITDVNYINCPVVIELPTNPDAKWYPAVYLTEVWRSTGCTYTRNDTKYVNFVFEQDSD